ncbi:MAG: helix-hairpin-helix domain-containing protein [Chromatiales bacterium]|jgi:putative hydrolase
MAESLNRQIASKLQEMSDLLQQQGANPFRIRAYRQAAAALHRQSRPVDEILKQEGIAGLEGLPAIGKGIAASIREMVLSGNWSQLQRLRHGAEGVTLLQTVPGLGPELAQRIHDELHVDTLEALENAAYDGSLERVKGLGERRLSALRASLASMLGQPRMRARKEPEKSPEAALLLEVDRLYRENAETGDLPRIAPKRFNPSAEAWLPVLHTDRAGWHFTALYSNTARAHQLGTTRDWVVIYFYDDHQQEGQHTVVTETHGPLVGQRVVRGMEQACRRYYGLP